MLISNKNTHMQTLLFAENIFPFDLSTTRAKLVDKKLVKMIRIIKTGIIEEEIC